MQLPCRRVRRPRRVFRQWPAASCSAAMASRLAVSLNRPRLGMPPRPPRPPRSPRQRRPRSRTCPVPSCPASPRMVSRSRRAAAFGMLVYAANRSGGPSRDPPPLPRRAPWRIRARMPVHLPGELRNALAFRKRHPDAGGLLGRRALHAGFPPAVRSPGLSALPPTMPRKGGLKVALPYHVAPRWHYRRVFSIPRRRCAPAPFRALSLPTSPPRRLHCRRRERRCAPSRR